MNKIEYVLCSHANTFKACEGCQHSRPHPSIEYCFSIGECCQEDLSKAITKVVCRSVEEKE
jgi:hypothetical protein